MNNNKKAVKLFFSVMLFLFILKLYVFITDKYNISIPCLFHEITGLYCPGCGITRMGFLSFRI